MELSGDKKMSGKILVISAHPDDEVLGCGGAIARHVAQGDDVHLLFLADGVKSRVNHNNNDISSRIQEAKKSHRILEIKSAKYLNYPDNQLDTVPLLELVKCIEQVIEIISPEIVYTHSMADLNIDHRISHMATITALRPKPSCSTKKILAYEVLSSTEWMGGTISTFKPNYFIDISDYLEIKINAALAYGEEILDSPNARSIENIRALATYRGHTVGKKAAEAFELIREIY